MPTTRVILDTDIGDDIDDAVCLAYLLAQPRCDLLGVTTVTETDDLKRARLAGALCRAAGRDDVPILPGACDPLLVDRRDGHAPQSPALERWEHASDYPRGEAVEFLRRTIRAHPGEVVLVAVGPMTNLALLFAADPEAAGMLKALHLMCGVFTRRRPERSDVEWNACSDPHATAIVYRARPPVHRSFGLDVTMQVALSREQAYERFVGQTHACLRDMMDLYFTWSSRMTFHDPLAAACVFEPDLCAYQRGLVEVETEGARLRGHTGWRPAETDAPGTEPTAAAPHEVAVTVQPERFFEHYFSVFA